MFSVYLMYPQWVAAYHKRIDEIFANETTREEFLKLYWTDNLFGSIYMDTDRCINERDKITAYEVADFMSMSVP